MMTSDDDSVIGVGVCLELQRDADAMFVVRVSFLEIYNEKIKDLLVTGEISDCRSRQGLFLRRLGSQTLYLPPPAFDVLSALPFLYAHRSRSSRAESLHGASPARGATQIQFQQALFGM